MIFLAICYGLITYWLTYHWQSTSFAADLFGLSYRNLSILVLSVAPWIAAYFPLRAKLPKLPLVTLALLATLSSLLILDIIYHIYYSANASDIGGIKSVDEIIRPRLIDKIDIALRSAAGIAKPIVITACLIYPIFVIVKKINEKRHR